MSEHREIKLMMKDYRLTTAEILYHLPDHPALLQSFIWQQFDLAPKFPVLSKFLDFWNREIEGKIHSVQVAHAELILPPEFKFVSGSTLIH